MVVGSKLIIGVGYLGIQVASLWSDENAPLYGTTRNHERDREFLARGILPIRWNVLDGGDSLPEVDTVVYAVGYDRRSSADKHEVYVEGLRRTLKRLPAPRLFIYISSTGVYGDHAGDWIDESTPPAPIDSGGEACLAAESVLHEFAQKKHLDVVVLRLAGIYGPGRVIGIDRLRNGEPISGNPEGWLNLIHVEDGARVIDAARHHATAGETYLVSDGNPVHRSEFYSYLALRANAPPPKFDPAAASRHRGDRRVNNQKMIRELEPELAYSTYREGIDQSLIPSDTS